MLLAGFEQVRVDLVLGNPQSHFPLGQSKLSGGLGHIPFSRFESIEDQLPLEIIERLGEGAGQPGSGRFRAL